MFWKSSAWWAILIWLIFCCVARGQAAGIVVTGTAPLDTDKYQHWQYDSSVHPLPPLPETAAAKKLGGRVGFHVETDKGGSVRTVTVTRSSGSPVLDETARTWVKYVWRYPKAEKLSAYEEEISFRVTRKDSSDAAIDVAKARLIDPNFPRPPYFNVAWHLHWQGTVGLILVPNGKGGVEKAKLTKSSGFAWLDVMTQAWAETFWKLPNNVNTPASVVYHLL